MLHLPLALHKDCLETFNSNFCVDVTYQTDTFKGTIFSPSHSLENLYFYIRITKRTSLEQQSFKPYTKSFKERWKLVM